MATWIEVALNGGWGRRYQPRIPVTARELIEEGVHCADEGASIIHFHSYDEHGVSRVDADLCARVIEGIRERRDVIVYPTIDSERAPDGELTLTGPQRYAELERLAERKLLEWVPIDPGSVHLALYAGIEQGRHGVTYLNSESDVRLGLALCDRHRLVPTFAIYEPGFLRLGAALARQFPELRPATYRLMLTDGLTFGFPARDYALTAYDALRAEFASHAPWMVAGYSFDPTPLVPKILELGGHVRVGLEDAPFGSERSNMQWVAHAVREIRRAGGDVASTAEVRSGSRASH